MKPLHCIDAGTQDTVFLNPNRMQKISPEWLNIAELVPEAWKHERRSDCDEKGIPHHFFRKDEKSRHGVVLYEMCLVSRVLHAGDSAKQVVVVLESPERLADRMHSATSGTGTDPYWDFAPLVCDGVWLDDPDGAF